jgi:predicted Zn-ribbon and HTH transcriptional regulator
MKTINQLEQHKKEIEDKIREMRVSPKNEATCLTCGYQWDTKSTKIYVNCPSCRCPVKINKIPEKAAQ